MGDDSRVAGCLLGIACGDALGRPVAGLTGAQITREYGRVTRCGATTGRRGR